MLSTFIAKAIGACFRIPLTNILGAEGMGVYQLVYPVYSLILTTSSGALPIAVSVLVSAAVAKGEKENSRGLVSAALSALLMVGVVLTMAMVLLSGTLGRLQGSEATRLGYIAIAPSILCVSGIAVLKGWFQGNNDMLPSAISQITEACVKLALGLLLAYLLLPKGIEWAVAGALAGVSASELATLIILYIVYRRKNPPLKLSLNYRAARARYKEILRISLPITIGGVIFPLTQMIDSFLVVNILSRTAGTQAATAAYGLFSGPVSTLINLPITLGLALGVAVVPQLSKGKAERDLSAIKLKTATALKAALIVGVPFAVLYLAAPLPVLGLLYGGLSAEELATAAVLMRIGAVTVLALSVMQISTSVLQGLGETRAPIINMAIGGAIKIVLDVVLLFTLGINGVAYASLAAFVAAAALNSLSLIRLMGKSGDIFKNSGVIVAAGGIMAVTVLPVALFASSAWWILAAAALGVALYLAAVLLLPVFAPEEMLSLPFGGKLAALRNKLIKKGGARPAE